MSNLIVIQDIAAPILSGSMADIKKYIALPSPSGLPNLMRLSKEGGDEAVTNVLQKAFDTIAEGVGAKNAITENQTVAIQNNFDVLTPHELAKFVFNASTLRYKTKYHSLKEGLTMEVLMAWLDVFLDDRETNLRAQPLASVDVEAIAKTDPIFDLDQAVREKYKKVMEAGKKSEQELAGVGALKNIYFMYQQFIVLGCDTEKEARQKEAIIKELNERFEKMYPKKLPNGKPHPQLGRRRHETYNQNILLTTFGVLLYGKTEAEQNDKFSQLKELRAWYEYESGQYADDFVSEYEAWSEKWYGEPINPNRQLTMPDLWGKLPILMNRHYDKFNSTEAFYTSLKVKGNNNDSKFAAVTGIIDYLKKKAMADYRSRIEQILRRDIPILDFQYTFWYIKNEIEKAALNNN